MRFAAIADIHGNALALEAALADIDAQGITAIINLGDVFSGPLDAGSTARLLRERPMPTVRGNHDRYLIEQLPEAMGPSDRVAYDQLAPQDLDWLRTLPFSLSPFRGVYACHATPLVDDQYWMERVRENGSIGQASLAEIEAQLNAEARQVQLILCAHTHLARTVTLSSGALLVNPGSIGCPAYDDVLPVPHHMQTGTPMASYAVLEKPDNQWRATLRWVPYDHASAAAQARAHGRHDWAGGLETGWYPMKA